MTLIFPAKIMSGRMSPRMITFFIPDYGYIRKYVRNRYLRRYQVFDENGRSIDIRTWNIGVG